jgi:hypothetical protein
MKKSSSDKLKMYSALAGTAIASSAGAQVVFTDINPDTVLHDTIFYNLDLNGDATPDFKFLTDTLQGSSMIANFADVNIVGANTDAILGSLYYNTYPFPFQLNNGDSILPANPNWNSYAQNSGLGYLGAFFPPNINYGNWNGVQDKYIGLRIDVAGQFHYGWARLSVSPHADTITIKEYAYNQTPNQYIVAGYVAGVPLHPNATGINVHSFENAVFVHTPTPQNGGTISVYNVNGQLIREEEITSGEMRIEMNDQPTGMYVVQVRQGELETSQKIYLK